MEPAVGRAHAAGLDPLDGLGDHLGMRPLDGVVEVGRDHQALAGRPVVRSQLLAEHGVADVASRGSRGRRARSIRARSSGCRPRRWRTCRRGRRAPAGTAGGPRARPRRSCRCSSSTAGFSLGMIHCAVRWNKERWDTRSTTPETIWTPVDPVPMMPSRTPSRSTEWSQRALWNTSATEAVEPLDVRVPRMVEDAGGGDDHVGHVLWPDSVVSCHLPS